MNINSGNSSVSLIPSRSPCSSHIYCFSLLSCTFHRCFGSCQLHSYTYLSLPCFHGYFAFNCLNEFSVCRSSQLDVWGLHMSYMRDLWSNQAWLDFWTHTHCPLVIYVDGYYTAYLSSTFFNWRMRTSGTGGGAVVFGSYPLFPYLLI